MLLLSTMSGITPSVVNEHCSPSSFTVTSLSAVCVCSYSLKVKERVCWRCSCSHVSVKKIILSFLIFLQRPRQGFKLVLFQATFYTHFHLCCNIVEITVNSLCSGATLMGGMMDSAHCILLWEQQWVRWSSRQEIRWLRPPCRSLSPHHPCVAAAPLLSICCLPSCNLPLSSQVEACICMQSGCTVKLVVIVWLWKKQYATFHLIGRSALLVSSLFTPELVKVPLCQTPWWAVTSSGPRLTSQTSVESPQALANREHQQYSNQFQRKYKSYNSQTGRFLC